MDKIKNNFDYKKKTTNIRYNFCKTLGVHLIELRHSRNLTAAEVCENINISLIELDYIESGQANINWKIISNLFDYYHVQLKLELCEDKTLKEKEPDVSPLSEKMLEFLIKDNLA